MTHPATTHADRSTGEHGDAVPLRVGGPCPRCGGEVEDLDFLSLPPVAIKREMYDVCVLDTDDLPTPWRHRTAVAYHEDPDPFRESASTTGPNFG